ncbi:peptidase S8 and S53 subtilisin kexin sedolisin [Actinoplanes sp. ATCC 53533]|uniref:S8 family serine peptidase n=1 Tax=Actinoplanes sp. ATCC 53533 TaxID=1288362 RepID=UPI000F77F7AD|nr:S8 family serine peptidase [Actinoplanes sp. ATCC 53533]RSM46260.1 peptidase S8 and S53 subtilisin kexin sedolisin [Actinoplanes sp. ATCC 53533]
MPVTPRTKKLTGFCTATLASLLTVQLVATSAAPLLAAAGPRGLPAGGWSGMWLSGESSQTPSTTPTTLQQIRTIIGADTGTAATLTGKGVGIALIDTGVAPVAGLPAAQIVNGPDLSFESQSASLRYLDTYGHGTHMAGIMVGNDTATGTRGLAPQAKITSVKVGTANGAVDVTQVIAAIDWVVKNRNHDPANPIRVINLSYGTGGSPTTWNDPMALAVELAWKAGIVVVAAAGNQGNSFPRMTHPAMDLWLIAVGATATKGTTATTDDELSQFTNIPQQDKPIDLLAPGTSIPSLRVPGSNIDNTFPAARTGDTLFRGSGTSQAAAVTSAAAALLLQAKPSLTPDQVKDLLKQGTFLQVGKAAGMGLREINVNRALALTPTLVRQSWMLSTSTGTIEATRGTSHVVANDVTLSGEKGLFGPFSGTAWAAKAVTQTSWSGGKWMGYQMAGDGWTGTSFSAKTWGAATWPGKPWGGTGSWTDPAWSGRQWEGRFWAAGTWTGRFWASDDWSGSSWE